MRKIAIGLGMLFMGTLAALPTYSQALANQVLGLLPERTGEVAFLDVKTLRGSPHYPQLKAQVLPDRFRSLVEWTRYLGIDFDRDVTQLSWAFLPADASGQVGLVGIAEGDFPPDEIEREVARKKLPATREAGHLVVSLGKNDKGTEFVFAFVDRSTAVFGFREPALEILARRAQGGQSLLNNRALMDVVTRVNGKAPVWIAMDKQFTYLAVRQMLPGIENIPGVDTLAQRLSSSAIQLAVDSAMRGQAALRCENGSDAMLVSTLMQAALAYQTWRLNDSNPDLARVLGTMNLNRSDESIELALTISPNDLATLISKNSFALKF